MSDRYRMRELTDPILEVWEVYDAKTLEVFGTFSCKKGGDARERASRYIDRLVFRDTDAGIETEQDKGE